MCFSCVGANPLIGQETVLRDTVWGSSFHDGHSGHSKSEFRHLRSIHMYQTNMLWRCSRSFRRYFWSKHHVFCAMYEQCDLAIPTHKAAANIVHLFIAFDHKSRLLLFVCTILMRFLISGLEILECKRRWKAIRDRYVKETRAAKGKSGAGRDDAQPSTWVLFKFLSFLDGQIRRRR